MLCMLLKTIRFKDFEDQLIIIDADSVVYVDTLEGIAYCPERDIHFTIEKIEYTTMG